MFKKGYVPWNKKYYIEDLQQLCLCNCGQMTSGRIDHGIVPKYIKGHWKVGKKQVYKPRLSTRGRIPWNWKGGVDKERHRLMKQAEYILWRKAVFERDDYTCQMCFTKGGFLNADHIKPWVTFPEFRYAIDNGRTLCVDCHRQTGTWGFKGIAIEDRKEYRN